jgi:hypothetical protein
MAYRSDGILLNMRNMQVPSGKSAGAVDHLPNPQNVWGMEGNRGERYFMETLSYGQGIFGRYSGLRI